MKNEGCIVCKIATVVVCIGAINWGAIAFFQLDLVAQVFGAATQASQIVYGVVGVAGVLKLLSLFITFPCCKGSCDKK